MRKQKDLIINIIATSSQAGAPHALPIVFIVDGVLSSSGTAISPAADSGRDFLVELWASFVFKVSIKTAVSMTGVA